MKSLTKYLNEKLVVNKDYKDASISPKSFEALRHIIRDRYNKLGAGTQQKPIDFNDVDVSNVDSFYSVNMNMGIFENTKENRQLFTNMLYNAGGVRIAGHLKVKSRKTTALTYFVRQLEKAVTKLDPACEVTTDKWKVVETWCRDKNGEKFGNNVLAASKSNPRCSNAIDNAVSLLLQKSESSLFSAQRNI